MPCNCAVISSDTDTDKSTDTDKLIQIPILY